MPLRRERGGAEHTAYCSDAAQKGPLDTWPGTPVAASSEAVAQYHVIWMVEEGSTASEKELSQIVSYLVETHVKKSQRRRKTVDGADADGSPARGGYSIILRMSAILSVVFVVAGAMATILVHYLRGRRWERLDRHNGESCR